ncbi:MAG: Fic family protein [Thermodesulfobacteriota bacterium]
MSSDQVSDQVGALLRVMAQDRPQSAAELMAALDLSHRPSFRKHYLHPAAQDGLIAMTIPGKPNSRWQRYRLTEKGRVVQSRLRVGESCHARGAPEWVKRRNLAMVASHKSYRSYKSHGSQERTGAMRSGVPRSCGPAARSSPAGNGMPVASG